MPISAPLGMRAASSALNAQAQAVDPASVREGDEEEDFLNTSELEVSAVAPDENGQSDEICLEEADDQEDLETWVSASNLKYELLADEFKEIMVSAVNDTDGNAIKVELSRGVKQRESSEQKSGGGDGWAYYCCSPAQAHFFPNWRDRPIRWNYSEDAGPEQCHFHLCLENAGHLVLIGGSERSSSLYTIQQ